MPVKKIITKIGKSASINRKIGSKRTKANSSSKTNYKARIISDSKVKLIHKKDGSIVIQMDLEDFEKIKKKLIKAEQKATVKKDLTNAFHQVKLMQEGKSEKTTLQDFLNEL